MRTLLHIKVYGFIGFPTDPSSRFPVDHIENLSFDMECDSTVFDLKAQYSSRRNVPAGRQYLIQPLVQDLQKAGKGPEYFIVDEISEFENSDRFDDFNVWSGEVFALLVSEDTSINH